MTGLKRGTVTLTPHQLAWRKEAERTIQQLNHLLGNTAVDIQHVGSTAIPSIHAKPIIDIAVGVRGLHDVMPYVDVLREHGVLFRGSDVPGQVLFVRGDPDRDLRTHHIHVVEWNGDEWYHYINFRDYLRQFPEKAAVYDRCKQELATRFSDDRRRYTQGKQPLIQVLLAQARRWRAER